MNTSAKNWRIEAEIHIRADSWDDLADMIDAAEKEVRDAKEADENFYWTNGTEGAEAEVSIKREVRHDGAT
ncbi:MAG: hypothetical protein H6867_04925 [Rhodospirillales bacterium]|nr:hypothetical protein [Rhodospirillales bacterium]MCB9994844.1 hypothetical protein [Rhodospirillales bacterium]